MRINVTDLPLHMQKQALRKLAEEEKRRNRTALDWDDSSVIESEKKPKNKYGAKKVTLEMPDGTEHTFDSKHEAEIYQELALMEKAGEISNLRIQVPYELIPPQVAPSGKKYRNCKYIADFVYEDAEGNTVVSDAKGHRTKEYILKKKLMLKVWGIEIMEV